MVEFFRFIFLCILTLAYSSVAQIDPGCQLAKTCNQTGECSFVDYNQMNATNCHPNGIYRSTHLRFNANGKLAFQPNKLELYKAMRYFNAIEPSLSDIRYVGLTFFEFVGFDLDGSKWLTHNELLTHINFGITATVLNLQVNGVPLTQDNCITFDWPDNTTSVFQIFDYIILAGCMYTDKLCPQMFRNANISVLRIDIELLEFSGQSTELNSVILELSLETVSIKRLGKNILHPDVFKHIKQLDLFQTTLHIIETDVFKPFKDLNFILLYLNNLKGFFHSQPFEWPKYINYELDITSEFQSIMANASAGLWSASQIDQIKKKKVSLTFSVQSSYQDRDQYTYLYSGAFFPNYVYTFPDTDFCLFADFPHQNFILPSLLGLPNSNFSCSVLYFFKYYWFYLYINATRLLDLGLTDFHITKVSVFDQAMKDCKFEERRNACRISQTASQLLKSDQFFDLYYLSVGLNEAKSVVIKYMGPSFSFIGCITNSLTILTLLYNYKRKAQIKNKTGNKAKIEEIVLLKEPLYKYMLAASVINLIYCFMYLLDYTIPCNSPISYHYAFKLTDLSCATRDNVISTLGSMLKLMSNLSLLQMAVCRYILTGKGHSAAWKILGEINLKLFFVSSIVSSILLSVVIYFQKMFFLPTIGSQTIASGEKYEFYFWAYYLGIDTTRISVKWKINSIPVLFTFTFIHDLFSYFLYCIMSTVLDVLTIKKLRETLQEKLKITPGSNVKDVNKTVERKGILMIVINSLCNFILRSLELVALALFYSFSFESKFTFKVLCWSFRQCETFVNLANVFYILSLSINFFFYYKFNRAFKNSFTQIFLLLRKEENEFING